MIHLPLPIGRSAQPQAALPWNEDETIDVRPAGVPRIVRAKVKTKMGTVPIFSLPPWRGNVRMREYGPTSSRDTNYAERHKTRHCLSVSGASAITRPRRHEEAVMPTYTHRGRSESTIPTTETCGRLLRRCPEENAATIR